MYTVDHAPDGYETIAAAVMAAYLCSGPGQVLVSALAAFEVTPAQLAAALNCTQDHVARMLKSEVAIPHEAWDYLGRRYRHEV